MATRAHITLVVDRSGSMGTIRDEAEAGIRQFISEQAALDGVKVKALLYQFDGIFEHVFGPVKAKNAPAYTLKPRAMTALYDAVGKSIEGTKAVVDAAAEEGKRPDKVVVVIMTDGYENASREHTLASITRLVEEQKQAGWEFIFLAGDLDAIKTGMQSGLATRGFDPRIAGQTHAVYAGASTSTAAYLSGTRATTAEDPSDSDAHPSPASR